jgi:predicted acetyltransferase
MQETKQPTKALWQSVFDDTAEFVDFYFENIFTEQNNIFIEKNGQIISALQAVDFLVKIENQVVPTAYLSGICTDKNFRNQGFMSELLRKTHRGLFEENYWAATLIPADENLEKMYETYGYSAIFSNNILTAKDTKTTQSKTGQTMQSPVIAGLTGNNLTVFELLKEDFSAAYQYFNAKNLERKFSLLATENYFKIILKYFELEKRKILVAKECGNFVGMAFVNEEGKVLEFFFDNENAKTALLDFICQIFDNQQIITSSPRGMLRIINVEKFLNFYAENFPAHERKIAVFDKDIVENCGNFFIKNGVVTKIHSKSLNYPLIPLKKLAEMLLKNLQPRMTIMLNE